MFFYRVVQNLHTCETCGVGTCGTAASRVSRGLPLVEASFVVGVMVYVLRELHEVGGSRRRIQHLIKVADAKSRESHQIHTPRVYWSPQVEPKQLRGCVLKGTRVCSGGY